MKRKETKALQQQQQHLSSFAHLSYRFEEDDRYVEQKAIHSLKEG